MANKKKTSANWQLAGEPVYPITLPPADENILSNCFSFHREFRQQATSPLFTIPMSIMKSRESAARSSLGFLCKHFGDKYQRHEIIDAVATAASLPVQLTERITESTSFLLGAALWLLDYFEGSDTKSKFLALLPETADDAVFFEIPMMDDFDHSPGVILRLMTVLCDRKNTGRSAFRNILRLIDKETAASLRSTFKECFLDYFGRYMEVCTRVRPAAPAKNGSELPPDFPSLSDIGPRSMGLDSASAIASITEDEPNVTFLLLTPMLIGASEKELRSHLHFRRSVDMLRGFCVSDPYAICAAYLLLEKEGDALACLNMLTCAVISCADQHLPWGAGEANAFPKSSEAGAPDYTLRYTYADADDGTEESDELPDVPVEDGWQLSEAQLFYFATGYALPRRCAPSQELTRWFVRQGLSEERAREFSFGAMLASYQDDLREQMYLELPFEDLDLDDEEEAGEDEAEADSPETEADHTAQIADLTRQVKDLRRALHESERAAKQLQEQLLEDERRSAQDRLELTRLRSVLYQIKSGEAESEQQEEAEIEFPWQVTRRVLIFGGHETWLKAIRPLLPGARFHERETLPDLAAIKGADVVWIQANALSHKLFYRIINSARKENIPVRYFGYASARKCAEQLVMDEMENAVD